MYYKYFDFCKGAKRRAKERTQRQQNQELELPMNEETNQARDVVSLVLTSIEMQPLDGDHDCLEQPGLIDSNQVVGQQQVFKQQTERIKELE